MPSEKCTKTVSNENFFIQQQNKGNENNDKKLQLTTNQQTLENCSNNLNERNQQENIGNLGTSSPGMVQKA